jgi:hypothetical protein
LNADFGATVSAFPNVGQLSVEKSLRGAVRLIDEPPLDDGDALCWGARHHRRRMLGADKRLGLVCSSAGSVSFCHMERFVARNRSLKAERSSQRTARPSDRGLALVSFYFVG